MEDPAGPSSAKAPRSFRHSGGLTRRQMLASVTALAATGLPAEAWSESGLPARQDGTAGLTDTATASPDAVQDDVALKVGGEVTAVTVTDHILRRTFRIRYDGSTGTCFTVDVEGRRYLITAKHVVESIRSDAVLQISRDGDWVPLRVRLVGHSAGGIDVTTLAPQELFGMSHPLRLTTKGLALAEDVYFLGFPYGLGMDVKTKLNEGFPLPLVKKAAVSALGLEDGPILLDGHVNPGFSGGPVVRRWSSERQTVIGVVSAYRLDRHQVRDETGTETTHTYDTNTGILFAHDIRHALASIATNPIGIPVA